MAGLREGALLLLMVPDDPESGCFYIYDRGRGQFHPLSLPVEGRYGGFREDEFEVLAQTFGLAGMARDPHPESMNAIVFGGLQPMPYTELVSTKTEHSRTTTSEMAAEFRFVR